MCQIFDKYQGTNMGGKSPCNIAGSHTIAHCMLKHACCRCSEGYSEGWLRYS